VCVCVCVYTRMSYVPLTCPQPLHTSISRIIDTPSVYYTVCGVLPCEALYRARSQPSLPTHALHFSYVCTGV
jgi:hypothetical protein